MKRYLVVVQLPMKNTRVSEVIGNLGTALRTADAYPTRPSVILSSDSFTMLRHARSALEVPTQKWMTTKSFLAHVYAIAALFDFKPEIVANVSGWDMRKAQRRE